jgi:phosphoglycolate phosphatase-like HAD superfamily hydrolase
MHLIMFDLDGTLLQSNSLDVRCFSGALKEVLGVESVNGDWGNFKYVTDEGIVAEIAAGKLNRPATREEMATLKSKILELLKNQAETSREAFAPIPGALEIVMSLRDTPACGLALATGCWRESARLKLSTAGFDMENLPLASCDDSHRREEIMQVAHQRALQRFGRQRFETVTYVGDAVWDLRASRKMGFDFIGIGFYGTGDALQREGAAHVVSDYADQQAFFQALTQIWGRRSASRKQTA